MPSKRWRSDGSVLTAFVVFSLALVAFLVSASSLPHTHASTTPALFNEDHDLSSLATLSSGSGLLPQTPSVAPLVIAAPLAIAPRANGLADQTHRSADSRAPPAR